MAKNLTNKNSLLTALIIVATFLIINSNVTGALTVGILNLQGQFSSADCNSLKGWACYPIYPTTALTIKVYEGTKLITTAQANQNLPAIATKCKTAYHGFTIPVPTSLKNNVPHTLTLYAYNPWKNTNAPLPGNPKTITCAAPASCTDNIKNQDETDKDCGGSACTTRCSVTQTCNQNSDCTTNYCSSGVCANQPPAATCTDGIKNGAETDIDCGGSTCPKCAVGKACFTWNDCAVQSGEIADCMNGFCATCSETDPQYGTANASITTQGTMTVKTGSGTSNYTDSCASSTMLNEYVCNLGRYYWSGIPISVNCNQNATTTCSNGACI